MVSGKSKVNNFKELQEKITKRVMGGRKSLYPKQVGRFWLRRLPKLYLPTPYVYSNYQMPFLMAELCFNPSFVWRSLLAAKDVLREGSTWQIGDGSRIGVSLLTWTKCGDEGVRVDRPEFMSHPKPQRVWSMRKTSQSSCRFFLSFLFDNPIHKIILSSNIKNYHNNSIEYTLRVSQNSK